MAIGLTADDVRPLVATALSDVELEGIIGHEEAELERLFGAADGEHTVTLRGGGFDLFLPRPISTVTSVSERSALSSSLVTVEATSYFVWAAEGRLERLTGRWGAVVVVAYEPQDDSDLRRSCLIDLVRLAIEQTALKSESVAGEYSYTAPDSWEKQRADVYRRMRTFGIAL